MRGHAAAGRGGRGAGGAAERPPGLKIPGEGKINRALGGRSRRLHKEAQRVPKHGPKKSRSCQNNEYRRGAFYSRRCRTVLFTVPLISAGTARRLPASKGQDSVFFPRVAVCALQAGEFCSVFFLSSAKQTLVQRQGSCNVHAERGRAAIAHVNSSRLILLCESPGKMSSKI